MKKIFCLTCNDIPVAASEEAEKLKKLMKESMERIKDSDFFEILCMEENSISYHDGISYLTNKYQIEEIDVL